MCCRTTVHGAPWTDDPELEALLTAAGMEPWPVNTVYGQESKTWHRAFDAEKQVYAAKHERGLQFSILPPIGQHTYEHHQVNALLGAFIFELAGKVGERFSLEVSQDQLVAQCEAEVNEETGRIGPAHPSIIIARYPESPMQFGHVCRGFRAVLYGGVHQYLDSDKFEAAISEPVPRVRI